VRGHPVRSSLDWGNAVNVVRNGLIAAAVGALMVLPTSVAHAQTSQTLPVTSFSAPYNQGWLIDENGIGGIAYPYRFEASNNPPLGKGSLQFAESKSGIGPEKIFIKHEENLPATNFLSTSFSYYFAPDSAKKSPNLFYLNVYVDTPAAGDRFYDCRYDFVATAPADGTWSSLTVGRSTPPTAVASSTGVVCGATLAALTSTDRIFRIAINGGDTSLTDEGLKGGVDKVQIRSTTSDITYDFEPATGCAQKGLPTVDGTPGNDLKNGTPSVEKIDLKGGNDMSDAGAGSDCVLGGDGADRLTAGAGDDEVQAGAGNDYVIASAGEDKVDAGPGNDYVNVRDGVADTVDCGTGTDLVVADRGIDKIAPNCESGA
jgi:hypothetical protein